MRQLARRRPTGGRACRDAQGLSYSATDRRRGPRLGDANEERVVYQVVGGQKGDVVAQDLATAAHPGALQVITLVNRARREEARLDYHHAHLQAQRWCVGAAGSIETCQVGRGCWRVRARRRGGAGGLPMAWEGRRGATTARRGRTQRQSKG
eukprot:scaffold7320_cov139-Isochrysis_galbana.AAC.7